MTMWDERFAGPDFAYGQAPNQWLATCASRIPKGGKILSLGEGEGRNAVWLAEQGYSVDAVDSSAVGLEKARRLATDRGVVVSTTVADLADYAPTAGVYNAVVLVYLHLPPALRRRVHSLAQAALEPGGWLVLEAFTPRQLANASGGPRQADWLYEPATLREDFPNLEWETLEESTVTLAEGALHQGPAAVVRALGRLPGSARFCSCF